MARSGRTRTTTTNERGQAYTLEGVIGAVLLLSALLFSMQSLALTPTTPGAVDGTVHAELHGQASDVLTTSASRGDLSRTVRYFNNSTVERTFAGAVRPSVGYAEDAPPTAFGDLLSDALSARGYRFNVDLVYLTSREPTRGETLRLVYHGTPSADAVVATYPVTLYDDDELTGPRTANETVAEAHRSGRYPIPDVATDGPLYNVVEVRLVVW